MQDLRRGSRGVLDQTAPGLKPLIQLHLHLAPVAKGKIGLYLSAEVIYPAQRVLVNGLEGIPTRGMHLANPCASMDGAVVVIGCAVHDHADLGDIAGGNGSCTDGIHGGIAAGTIGAPLGADQHHRNRGL